MDLTQPGYRVLPTEGLPKRWINYNILRCGVIFRFNVNTLPSQTEICRNPHTSNDDVTKAAGDNPISALSMHYRYQLNDPLARIIISVSCRNAALISFSIYRTPPADARKPGRIICTPHQTRKGPRIDGVSGPLGFSADRTAHMIILNMRSCTVL